MSTPHQGQGIGQTLIHTGLRALQQRSVDVVVTYGDPAFYTKLGFAALSETQFPAPFQLSMPHGWLGQALNGSPIPTVHERPRCVTAFDNPSYW